MSQTTTVTETRKSSTASNGSGDASRLDNILKEAQLGLTKLLELVEAAKTVGGTASEFQAQIASAASDAQTKLAEITNTATEATAAKTKISDLQAVVVTKSEHVEDARVHADKVRADLDAKLTDAITHATEAESSKTRAQTAADNASTILAEITTTKGSVQTEAEVALKARKTAEESAEVTKALADKAATIEERVEGYEKRLGELETECTNRLKTIDELLPGATSAGLAHSLDKRRQGFLRPQKRWQAFFIGSLIGIIVIAINDWSTFTR
jgi:chromosome segregation ATPase